MLPMPPLSPLDQIAERVELLLAHHAELQRSNALLAGQVAALSMERDSLRSRLNAARARVDALVERLPASAPAPAPHPLTEPQAAAQSAAPDASDAPEAPEALSQPPSSPLHPKDAP